MTNKEKFLKYFGYDGTTVCDCPPGNFGQGGSCWYMRCFEESCASRYYPRCPYWWKDEASDSDKSMKKDEIMILINRMISEWDSVKTWASVCKRDALKELKDEIVRKDKCVK